MAKTKIEWAEYSWNPVCRCSYPADDPFRVTLHPERLEEPLRWRKPRRVFVCSMLDLFHPDVHYDYIAQVFEV